MPKTFLSLQAQEAPCAAHEQLDPYGFVNWQPAASENIEYADTAAADETPAGWSRTRELFGPLGVEPPAKCPAHARCVDGESQVMDLFPPDEVPNPLCHRTEYINPKRKDWRQDYVYLELAIQEKENERCVSLREPKVSFIHKPNPPKTPATPGCEETTNDEFILRVDDPVFSGSVPVLTASPRASQENITFTQTAEHLELKRQRTGDVINELPLADDVDADDDRSPVDDPRAFQSKLNAVPKQRFFVRRDAHTGRQDARIGTVPQAIKSRTRGTEILHDQRSIVRSERPAIDICADKSLAIAAVAYIYSKLDNVRYWSPKKVDEVLLLGIVFFDRWTKDLERGVEFEVAHIPPVCDMLGYRIRLHTQPEIASGPIAHKGPPACSELHCGLLRFFGGLGTQAVLVAGTNVAMVLWRTQAMYFLFSAFACDETGRYTDETGCACVLMNNRLVELIDVIDGNLERSAQRSEPECADEAAQFVIHEIRVQQVDKIGRNAYFDDNEMPSVQQHDCGARKVVLGDDGIPVVPFDELSELSVDAASRGERRAHHSARGAPPSLQGSDRDALRAIDEDAGRTLADVCERTLETVLERIEERIEMKCRMAPPPGYKVARKVLVQSDLGRLQRQKRAVRRGTDVPACVATRGGCRRSAAKRSRGLPAPTLSAELLLPTNMRALPDGVHIVHGTQNLLHAVEFNASIAVVAPVLAVVLSHKYGIHTWDAACVDFVLNTTKYVQECVPLEQYQMFRAPHNHLPDVQIGQRRFGLHVYSLCVGPARQLGKMIAAQMPSEAERDRLVLASVRYSVAIWRRRNFWYLFDAYASDALGLRCADPSRGTATFQRFADCAELVRRVRCNQQHDDEQMFSLNRVEVRDVSRTCGVVKPFKFVERPEHQEAEIIERLAREKAELMVRNNERLEELNERIREEKCRINQFYRNTGREYMRLNDEASLLAASDGGKVPAMRRCGAAPDESESSMMRFEQTLRMPYGYCCVAPDYFHKIQGSTHLRRRFRFRGYGVRACHFASVYASLLALNRQWSHWNFRVVDQCIEEGLNMYRNIDDVANCDTRGICRLMVDRSYYNISIEVWPREPAGTGKACVFEALRDYFRKRRYVLLQFPNCTFAIVKRNCYNLFDPYASQELRPGDEPFQLWQEPPLNVERTYDELNTASWICMPNLEVLLMYVEQRIRVRDLNTAFELYHIKVISTVRCALSDDAAFAKHMLTFTLPPAEAQNETFESQAQSVPDEEIRWVDAVHSVRSVPWSRRLAHNLRGDERGTEAAMHEAFDVELEADLWSLWSHVHPDAAAFAAPYRGRQYAGVNLVACCVAALYPVVEWNRRLLDWIVVAGDEYFGQRMAKKVCPEHEVRLEEVCGKVDLNVYRVCVEVEAQLAGTLYGTGVATDFNLKKALLYFFRESGVRLGVLTCFRRMLVVGRSVHLGRESYFMFDCQSRGVPLFQPWQGAAYVLVCTTLRRLLHCVVLTLRVPCYNVEFTLHAVRCVATTKAEGEPAQKPKRSKRQRSANNVNVGGGGGGAATAPTLVKTETVGAGK